MDALAIIKYACAVAVGAVSYFSLSSLYTTFGKRKGLTSLRPLRVLITGAAGRDLQTSVNFSGFLYVRTVQNAG